MSEHIKNPEINGHGAEIAVGSTVEVLYEGDEDALTLQIVGLHGEGGVETTMQKARVDSALAQALLNKKAGDTVTFVGPYKTSITVSILSVNRV